MVFFLFNCFVVYQCFRLFIIVDKCHIKVKNLSTTTDKYSTKHALKLLKYHPFSISLRSAKLSDFYFFLNNNAFATNLERSGHVDFNFIPWK